MSIDYELTRSTTHDRLVGQLEHLSQGHDTKSLASFAKAYLGMYLDLEKSISPDERVKLLADEDIIDSIWHGFDYLLHNPPEITPQIIASAYVEEARLDIGYILLAALDREIRQQNKVPELDDGLMATMICFYYVNRNELENRWVGYYAKTHSKLFADTLVEFWQAIEKLGSNQKPGFREILYKPEYIRILQDITLPVMRVFAHIKKYFLKNLLLAAFQYISLDDLLQVCKEHIENETDMPVVNRVYWLSTAYLLSPATYKDELFDYVGRTREKALPMLDFIEALLNRDVEQRFALSADMLADLLYMIAPKFRPVRDQFGNLDDNVEKIVRLCILLREDKSTAAQQAISRLKKIRVMRLYSEFL